MRVWTTRFLFLILLALFGTVSPTSGGAGSAPSPPAGAANVRVVPGSVDAVLRVRHASSEQLDDLLRAVRRFEEVGLDLPDLDVEFSTDDAVCDAHLGLFDYATTPWRISICSPAPFVYEHELAHAWELATITDELRGRFMELRGQTVWSDAAVPWSERGVEDAAFVIQQGLGGLPLPPTLSEEHRERLAAFALLTGRPAPLLLDWCHEHRGGPCPPSAGERAPGSGL